MNRRGLTLTAVFLGLALTAGSAFAAELEWPTGRWLKDGDTFYYPDGRWMLSSGTLYYPDGRWALSSGTLYYPNGRWLFSSDTWYMPDGTWAYKGWIGTLVDLKEGNTSLNVWRETDTSPVRVSIVVKDSEYQLEYLLWGDRNAARLWAIGRWIPLFGDQTLFDPPPKAKKGRHHGDGDDDGDGDGHHRHHDADDDDDDGDHARGDGDPYHLCGYDFYVEESTRTASEEMILDKNGKLWVVVLDSCKGGLIADSVDTFVVLTNGWTLYLHDDGSAWLLAEGAYFRVNTRVKGLRGGKKGRFELRVGGSWIKYSDPALEDGELRVFDNTAHKDVWLTSSDTFRWGW